MKWRVFGVIKVMKFDFNDEIVSAARTIWNYMVISPKKLQKADLIFILGSRDDRIARYAAKLYHEDIAQTILVSGGLRVKMTY